MEAELLPEDRHDEAVEFLLSIFPGAEGAPFIDREIRHWKYFAPHPFSAGSRCYVLRDAKGLLAHAGVSPVEYVIGGERKSSFQIIDWAGSPRRAGAGFLLYRALWNTADSYIGIGGTEDARKVMRSIPRMQTGYFMTHLAFPLRPFGQLLSSSWSWKSPGKWARSWRWRLARRRPDLRAWRAVPLERLTERDAALLRVDAAGAYVPLRRTPELVNYWMACPGARVRVWRLDFKNEPAGALALAFVKKEARILDLTVDTTRAPLSEAYSLAIDLAARERDACEVSAASSAPPVVAAMIEAGMIARGKSDVFLGDPKKLFPAGIPIEVNLSIGDGFYQQPKRPYFHTFG